MEGARAAQVLPCAAVGIAWFLVPHGGAEKWPTAQAVLCMGVSATGLQLWRPGWNTSSRVWQLVVGRKPAVDAARSIRANWAMGSTVCVGQGGVWWGGVERGVARQICYVRGSMRTWTLVFDWGSWGGWGTCGWWVQSGAPALNYYCCNGTFLK